MNVLGISDTHGKHLGVWNKIKREVDCSAYDMITHTGDISSNGSPEQIKDFLDWFGNLPFKHKVFILGNHEYDIYNAQAENLLKKEVKKYEGLHFLHHDYVVIDGICIFGSPYTPHIPMSGNKRAAAYKEDLKQLVDYWNEIPRDVDLLLTHGPCLGIGDSVDRLHVGDVALLAKIMEIQSNRPNRSLTHQFGHIHGQRGFYYVQSHPNLTFINASSLNDNYDIQPKPFMSYTIFEIED